MRSPVGAGERAFDVAEQLGFEQGLRGRAKVDRDHRMDRAPRQAMDFARDDLLAGAVFAEDQNVGVGRRGAVDQGPHALHRRRFAEQRRFGRRRKLRRAAALGARVDPAPAQRSRAAHRRREALVAPRLGDEIAGPRLDRLDRDRHRAMGGDDHHRGIGLLLHDLPKEIETFAPVGRAALEIEVEQDRVRAFPLRAAAGARPASATSPPVRTGRGAQDAQQARYRDRRRRRRQG